LIKGFICKFSRRGGIEKSSRRGAEDAEDAGRRGKKETTEDTEDTEEEIAKAEQT